MKVRRVPLEGATTPAQARDKLEERRVDRRKAQLPVSRRTPKFAEYADPYLDYYRKVEDVKRNSTFQTERYGMAIPVAATRRYRPARQSFPGVALVGPRCRGDVAFRLP